MFSILWHLWWITWPIWDILDFFKLLLKIAYIQTFFSDMFPQPSVQVYKWSSCFNRKAVPSCNSLTKLGVPRNSAAIMGSCSLFKLPNGPAAVGVLQRTEMVHCATLSAHCWGEMLQHFVWLQLPKTNGFMPTYILHCSSPDVHRSPIKSWLSITWPGQISHQLEPAKPINHRGCHSRAWQHRRNPAAVFKRHTVQGSGRWADFQRSPPALPLCPHLCLAQTQLQLPHSQAGLSQHSSNNFSKR